MALNHDDKCANCKHERHTHSTFTGGCMARGCCPPNMSSYWSKCRSFVEPVIQVFAPPSITTFNVDTYDQTRCVCNHKKISHSKEGYCVHYECWLDAKSDPSMTSQCQSFTPQSVPKKKEINEYPHQCTSCTMPALIGAFTIYCSNSGCRHRDRKLFPELC